MGPAREVIDKYGNAQDWRNTVGTGPFILTDYVSSSSLTAIRNPNYWGFDPQNSNNRIPYVDSVKIMIIPDLATAQAALRSGKIDLIENLNWQQATSITRTNPELLQVTRPGDAPCIMMKVDQKPFSDIRVRKAMQMTIDLPTIAKTYYNGTVEEKPMGLVGHKGWYIPFDQWPPEVQAGYTYNPEGAKKLLSDAGYPAGFKCTLSASSTDDLDLYQIMKSYLAAIGIDMQIQVMDSVTFAAYTRASKHEMATNPNTGTTCINPPIQALNYRYSGHTLYNTHHIKDPVFDEMWTKAQSISNEDELKQLIIEAGDYANAQQWVVTSVPTVSFCIYQPWLNRFHGEATTNVYGETFKWFWISKK
jgi:peptide/nickel transport system substrate-binding protein